MGLGSGGGGGFIKQLSALCAQGTVTRLKNTMIVQEHGGVFT